MFTETWYQDNIGMSKEDIQSAIKKHVTVQNCVKAILFCVLTILVACVVILGAFAALAWLALKETEEKVVMDNIPDESISNYGRQGLMTKKLKELKTIAAEEFDIEPIFVKEHHGPVSKKSSWVEAILYVQAA